jgi:hypothetical protein
MHFTVYRNLRLLVDAIPMSRQLKSMAGGHSRMRNLNSAPMRTDG